MAQRASFPATGGRPATHADGKALNRDGADLLAERDAATRRAAKVNPGRDASAENAARAKREGWTDGSLGGQHTPGQ
jgi:hypothetical protein